jgi:glutamyl-tRNA reductase
MAKLFEISKKYEVELDIAEAHTIEQALRQYGRDLDKQEIEEYIHELRNKINTVYERYASEINRRKKV